MTNLSYEITFLLGVEEIDGGEFVWTNVGLLPGSGIENLLRYSFGRVWTELCRVLAL